MQTKSLVEAKIIPVYNIKSPIYRKYIVIFLPTKTIFLFPAKRELRLVRNRKYSLRRLMRWALKGCRVEIKKQIIKDLLFIQQKRRQEKP
jgi:hypothetical protein